LVIALVNATLDLVGFVDKLQTALHRTPVTAIRRREIAEPDA
jgi:hypothetical protein